MIEIVFLNEFFDYCIVRNVLLEVEMVFWVEIERVVQLR